MKRILNLIHCENIKFYTTKYIVSWVMILVVLLILFSFIFEVIPKEKSNDYISELLILQKETVIKLTESINTTVDIGEKEALKKALDMCNINILKLEYCLNNNLSYDLSNVWWFLYKLQLISTGLLLLIITYISRIFDIENRYNMWKILYGNCMKKEQIILVKLVYSIINIFIFILIIYFLSFLIGYFKFSFNGNDIYYVEFVNGTVIKKNILISIALIFVLLLIKSIVYYFFMVFLQSFLKNDKISLIIICCMIIFNNTINSKLNNYEFSKYLPFKYLGFEIGDLIEKNYMGVIILPIIVLTMSIFIVKNNIRRDF